MTSPSGDPSHETQLRAFRLCQLPFVLLFLPVATGVAAYGPPVRDQTWLLVSLALVAACTVMALWAPWDRGWFAFRVVVPVLDIVAVGLLRLDVVDALPSVSIVAILPAIWLAFQFGRSGMALAIVSGTVVTALPYVRDTSAPATGLEWMRVLLVPAAIIGLTVTTRVVARQMDLNRHQLVNRTHELAESVDSSKNSLDVGQAILDNVDAAIWFYNVDTTLWLANPLAHDLARRGGFRLDEPPYVGDQVWQEDRCTPVPAAEQVVPRALRGDFVHDDVEWFGPRDDLTAVVFSARRVETADGGRLGTVIAGWDVTPLTEAIQAREEFLTTVSHELRTPLTSIIGYLEIVEDQLGPEEATVRRMLAIVQRNADTLLERISQLLNASESGVRFEPANIDVSSAIMTSLVKHAPGAAKAGLVLRTELEPSPWGHLDVARFEQVVDNLVSNAIKYTPRGGTITVALTNDTTTFDLMVSDTGIGMTTEDKRHAFDRFYRAGAARDSAIQGIGIGLGIVRTIVETHGGEIFLDSALGVGTTVTVRIPNTPAPPTAGRTGSRIGVGAEGIEPPTTSL